MSAVRRFLRHEGAAGAAEFALLLPLVLLFLLGIIDSGRFIWAVNQQEKATQIGARWAVATDMIPSGLYSYSFAASGGIAQGTTVPISAFPGVTCQSNGTTASCTCASGGTCNFPLTANQTAFTNLVNRMAQIKGDITATNVVVDYSWSGLGFAGDPNGPDVAPITTVRLRNLHFQPITTLLFGTSFNLPSYSYSLTMEDGSGQDAN